MFNQKPKEHITTETRTFRKLNEARDPLHTGCIISQQALVAIVGLRQCGHEYRDNLLQKTTPKPSP